MKRENKYFECAQAIYKTYSTHLSNESIENIVQKNVDSSIMKREFEKVNLSPREIINRFVLRYYPNETAIKSMFINNVLLKSNNHVTIFEFNVGSSRLDLCKINGSSTAFEIKTELDNSKRLRQQMEDYFKTFEKVYLICSENNLNTMITNIPENCGIYTYYVTKTGRYVFKKRRNAVCSDKISPRTQLSSLTKRDLSFYFGCPYLPCKNLMISTVIKNKSHKEINKMFKLCLKNKYSDKWDFLLENRADILEIDYQWFFKNLLSPKIVYL